MRKLIDNYIVASDSIKIGEFDDLTLLDFVEQKGQDLIHDVPDGKKEGAAEAIENNIRRKVVEKVTVNPRYYEKMSAILDKLIEERKQGVKDYKELLDYYVQLVKNVEHPEDNEDYPQEVRGSRALQAIYDNLPDDEETTKIDIAKQVHDAVLKNRIAGFRGDTIKENRIKRALLSILGDDMEVERMFKIIKKQEEY